MMQTEMQTVCCDIKKLEVLIRVKKDGKAKKLKNVIVFDEITEEDRRGAEEAGFKVYTYKDIIEVGKTTEEEIEF